MSVFKRYQGRRLKDSRDKDWSKGTWYVWKRVRGRVIHKAIPEAVTKEQAEQAERKLIEDVFNNRYGVKDRTTTVAEFADSTYLRYCTQNNTNLTAKKQYIGLITKRLGRMLITDLTPQNCRDFQAWLRRKMPSDSSVNRVMSTLSRMLTIACEEDLLEHNPMEHVRKLDEPQPREKSLTQVQKDKLWLELAKDPLMLRLVTLATNLPLRRGQLLSIRPDDVDLLRGWLSVGKSKGQKPRLVPLNATAAETLRVMIAEGQLPFPLKDFRKRWLPMLIAAGINEEGAKRGENYTFHDLRHYLASVLIHKHNVNPETVRQAFDHSDMSVTRIYINRDMDAIRDALNELDATNSQPTDVETGLPS